MMDLTRTPQHLGTLIRRARKKQGLSQAELGARCGFRQETISLVENGSPATRLDTLLAILAALELDLFVGGRPETSSFDIEDLLG
ncbi:helix-turn-helix domain-containing protein [Pedomonas sp. V897]|uniref:helix-turn-helix domain-containing protein n=1 Tax=Pedomonas sp. V897 TaxID=3446482 RepID=UPI003EE3BE65